MVLGGSGTITSDKITIDANGKIGVGNTNPQHAIDVGGANATSKYSRLGGMSIITADSDYEWWNGTFTTSPGPWELIRRKISDGTWTKHMGVDTSGRVTRPYQPMFYARHNNNSSASGRYGLFDDVLTNQGGHATHSTFGGSYSYTRFTCPIAGKYFVWVGNIGPNTGTTQRTYVHKNGSNNSAQLRTGQTSNHGTSASMNVIIDAAANDWIACYSASDDGSMAFYSGEYSHMGVILIG